MVTFQYGYINNTRFIALKLSNVFYLFTLGSVQRDEFMHKPIRNKYFSWSWYKMQQIHMVLCVTPQDTLKQ